MKKEEFKTNAKVDVKDLEWYTDIEYAQTRWGINSEVYKTAVEAKNKYYEIEVYPLTLFDKDYISWDYRILTIVKGEIVNEYDAGAEHERHFPNEYEAKKASMVTLNDMLKRE